MAETQHPESQPEGLNSHDEDIAIFWRKQQQGLVREMETPGVRQPAAEQAEFTHFERKTKEHMEANLGAYQETAKHEAEAEGHRIKM